MNGAVFSFSIGTGLIEIRHVMGAGSFLPCAMLVTLKATAPNR
jgi:hypothetical protein